MYIVGNVICLIGEIVRLTGKIIRLIEKNICLIGKDKSVLVKRRWVVGRRAEGCSPSISPLDWAKGGGNSFSKECFLLIDSLVC